MELREVVHLLIRDVLPEASVLLFADAELAARPNRLDEVESFAVHCDREVNEVRVLLDDSLHFLSVRERCAFRAQVDDYASTSRDTTVVDLRYVEGATAVTLPNVCIVFRLTARDHLWREVLEG